MKILKNWFLFLLILALIILPFYCWPVIKEYLPSTPTMTGPQAVVFGFALAFMWVEVLKAGRHKPFNCLKCMTGWAAGILAFTFHVEFWYMYLPVGLFVGAMFEGIKMRWL